MTDDPTPAELAKLLGTPRDAEARDTIRRIMRRKRLDAEAFAQEADATFRAAKQAQIRATAEYEARMDITYSYAALLEDHPEPPAGPNPTPAQRPPLE